MNHEEAAMQAARAGDAPRAQLHAQLATAAQLQRIADVLERAAGLS